MKGTLLLILLLISFISHAQNRVFIITIDGVRWQEVYKSDRLKLMPFFWNTISKDGVLMGNRDYHNYCNVSNFYHISYPGYNEILTGYPDPIFIPNLAIYNRNNNILEYLSQNGYYGKVVAFASWKKFSYILRKDNSTFPIYCGYNNDILTYRNAFNYIKLNHPSVVFLSFGETDEYAHQSNFKMYLNKITNADSLISELWKYCQLDTFYRGKTTFIITTDHGRGIKNWTSHGFWVSGSGETWMALIGPGISGGELKYKMQTYQKDVPFKVFKILGLKYTDVSSYHHTL